MNRINPQKLLLSKWTSKRPRNGEKHFMVISLLRDEQDRVIACDMEAVTSRRGFRIDWRDLNDSENWLFGWR